jgi:hypothetical protein
MRTRITLVSLLGTQHFVMIRPCQPCDRNTAVNLIAGMETEELDRLLRVEHADLINIDSFYRVAVVSAASPFTMARSRVQPSHDSNLSAARLATCS